MKKKFLTAFLLLLSAALFCACGEEIPPEISYTLDKTELTLIVGEEGTLTAAPSGEEEGQFIWTSENTAVATVSGEGLTASVTAVAEGKTTITFKVGETEKCRCSVTVLKTPVKCNVPSGRIVVRKNSVVTVKAWIAENLPGPVTWECSDESICTVEYQGNIALLTAVKRGECTVTARCGEYASSFVFVVGIN